MEATAAKQGAHCEPQPADHKCCDAPKCSKLQPVILQRVHRTRPAAPRSPAPWGLLESYPLEECVTVLGLRDLVHRHPSALRHHQQRPRWEGIFRVQPDLASCLLSPPMCSHFSPLDLIQGEPACSKCPFSPGRKSLFKPSKSKSQ